MSRFGKVAVAVGLSVAMLGGVAGTSLAEDPPPTATPQAQQQWQRGPGNGNGPRYGAGFQALSGSVAELLGMTPEQIQAERHAGKSLAEIAAAKGVSEDKLVEAMLAARKQLLDERVANGTLTQEQADAAYQQMQARIMESVSRTEVGPNRPANGLGLGLGWGRASGNGAGYGQPGQGTGPGQAHRYSGRAR